MKIDAFLNALNTATDAAVYDQWEISKGATHPTLKTTPEKVEPTCQACPEGSYCQGGEEIPCPVGAPSNCGFLVP